MTKICKKCLESKGLTDFYPNRRICKACIKKRWKERYHSEPILRAKHNSYCNNWASKNQDKLRANHLKRSVKAKQKVFYHYSKGAMACACCGENHFEFLSIDHIGGGGNYHRRKLLGKSGTMFYDWLIKQGFPTGYQVLCFNCNQADGNFGACPHKGGTIYTAYL